MMTFARGLESKIVPVGTLSTFLAQTPKMPYIQCRGGDCTFHIHSNSKTMRKIEKQMNQAIADSINWQSGNTSVQFDEQDNVSRVYLHGNHIATVSDDCVQLFDGGWQSVTTKSRLNAICDANAIAGEGVYQKDHVWYVRQYNNSTQSFEVVPFYSGLNLGESALPLAA